MSSLLWTWAIAALQVGSNAGQSIVSTFWTNSATPLYGLFIFIVCFLTVAFSIIAAATAFYYRDPSFFYLADNKEESSLFRRRKDGSLTQLQLLVRVSLSSTITAIIGWLATPPDRTPPLIQSVAASLPVVTAIPLSVWLLGDKKPYCSRVPMVAIAFILCGVGVSLVPAAMKIDASTHVFKGGSTIAWSFIAFLAQCLSGAIAVFQQEYLLRCGALNPGATRQDKLRPIIRVLFYNQFFVLAFGAMLFWVDILPWFGSSPSLDSFATGMRFCFECSIYGESKDPHAAAAYGWSCGPRDQAYAWSFEGLYVFYLLGVIFLNVDSAVFNSFVSVLCMCATSVFFLIPGTNPDPQDTPVWSAITSLLLALVGVFLFKQWEAKQGSSASQFQVAIETAASAGGASRKPGSFSGGGKVFSTHSGSAVDVSHLLADGDTDDELLLHSSNSPQHGYYSHGSSHGGDIGAPHDDGWLDPSYDNSGLGGALEDGSDYHLDVGGVTIASSTNNNNGSRYSNNNNHSGGGGFGGYGDDGEMLNHSAITSVSGGGAPSSLLLKGGSLTLMGLHHGSGGGNASAPLSINGGAAAASSSLRRGSGSFSMGGTSMGNTRGFAAAAAAVGSVNTGGAASSLLAAAQPSSASYARRSALGGWQSTTSTIVMIAVSLLLATVSTSAQAVAISAGRCRFAVDFTCEDFFADAGKAAEFKALVMQAEGSGFAQPGIGYDASTGFTYDGHPLNYTTGELYGSPHPFSASSKESIHVAMLALAVDGNPFALQFTGGAQAALDILAMKLASYRGYNATYPGYGCHFPWLNPSTMQPIDGWIGKVPGLDNGELAWSVFAAAAVLQKQLAMSSNSPIASDPRLPTLAQGFSDWFACMAASAPLVFWNGPNGGGNVSAVTAIVNMSAPVSTPGNYLHTPSGGYLNDPYEGETMTVLLDLFGGWESMPNGAALRDELWIAKRAMLQPVNYTFPVAPGQNVTLTTQRGFWASSHEQWKAGLLPYLTIPVVKQVFETLEKARSWDAFTSHLPGMLASVNDVSNGSEDIPDYISAAGIASLAFEAIDRRDVITPYGAWQLFLHNDTAGLCWYRNMLAASRMQGPHGSTEAINVNGTEISPLTTWDSKITSLLTMASGSGSNSSLGVGTIVGDALAAMPDAASSTAASSPMLFHERLAAIQSKLERGWKTLRERATTAGSSSSSTSTGASSSLLDRFVYIVDREYSRAFGGLPTDSSQVPFALPGVQVPPALSPWPSCS